MFLFFSLPASICCKSQNGNKDSSLPHTSCTLVARPAFAVRNPGRYLAWIQDNAQLVHFSRIRVFSLRALGEDGI